MGPVPGGFCVETSHLQSADARGTGNVVDWSTVDPEPLFDAIRERGPASDAERSVWAFERALVAARIDGDLLRHLLVACVCLVAHEEGETPRTVLERLFRRAVTDDEWFADFAPLFT
jgi:hypothetical protein